MSKCTAVPFFVAWGRGVYMGEINPFRWVRRLIKWIPGPTLVSGSIGLLVGLLLAALLALPLSFLPGLWGKILPIAVSIVLGFAGASIAVVRGGELFQLFGSLIPRRGRILGRGAPRNGQIIVDTSAIIDGRIADIAQTGFIQGTLLIPRFVLDELQHVADSSDWLRRNRGRRGLEVLSKLQKESVVRIKISDTDVKDVQQVDGKLVRLAKMLNCPIITCDFNLNRVARLQGVRVLNINELANAVKSVFLPGEEMEVRIIQEGKEFGQGVGFLDDGTMVVVEGGKRYLNTRLGVVVTRVLQTAAGRMIFARPKTE